MRTVFFDIDTQIDFLFPAGALYAPGAEKIIGTVATLNRYAAKHGIPVVSTMDAHSENDPEFRIGRTIASWIRWASKSRRRRCSKSALLCPIRLVHSP
jgi:nicotinamidase-related amidase